MPSTVEASARVRPLAKMSGVDRKLSPYTSQSITPAQNTTYIPSEMSEAERVRAT